VTSSNWGNSSGEMIKRVSRAAALAAKIKLGDAD